MFEAFASSLGAGQAFYTQYVESVRSAKGPAGYAKGDILRHKAQGVCVEVRFMSATRARWGAGLSGAHRTTNRVGFKVGLVKFYDGFLKCISIRLWF